MRLSRVLKQRVHLFENIFSIREEHAIPVLSWSNCVLSNVKDGFEPYIEICLTDSCLHSAGSRWLYPSTKCSLDSSFCFALAFRVVCCDTEFLLLCQGSVRRFFHLNSVRMSCLFWLNQSWCLCLLTPRAVLVAENTASLNTVHA